MGRIKKAYGVIKCVCDIVKDFFTTFYIISTYFNNKSQFNTSLTFIIAKVV